MTADRASIFQTIQLGVESVAGSAVAANKALNSLSIEPSIKADIKNFRPMGNKFPTLSALGKESVEAKIKGQQTYSELIYPLSSLITGVSGSGLGGSPVAYQWTFSPNSSGADSPKTFTVEQGDANMAHRFTGGLVTGLTFKFTRNETTLDGAMIGQALENGVTMTASPTSIDLVPVLAGQVDIYLADTHAGLDAAAALGRPLAVDVEIADRYNPVWAIGTATNSWASFVEAEPKATTKLKMEANTEGMALLANMRSGATKFIRIQALGATISGANKYKLRIDAALQVKDVSDFSDEDGVFAIEWSLAMVHDATWGKALEIIVVNKQSAL